MSTQGGNRTRDLPHARPKIIVILITIIIINKVKKKNKLKLDAVTLLYLPFLHSLKVYMNTEEPKNRDAFFECQYLLIYLNNCTQIHLALPNLTKFNIT